MPENYIESSRRALIASICAFCLALPLTIAGVNISWGFILLSLVVYRAFGGSVPLDARHSALEKPLWTYFAVAVVTALWGTDPAHSARHLNQDFHKVWIYLLFSVALTVEEAPQAPAFLALGFSTACLLGIGQVLAALAKTGAWERAHAFVHPVTFGEQACIALLGAACFLMDPEGVLDRPRAKAAAWALLILSTAALVLSGTRNALFASLAGILATWLILPRWRHRALFAAPPTAAALFYACFVWKARWGASLADAVSQWRQTGVLPAQGQLMRLTLWKVAWRMGLDHPWMGVGPSNYRPMFRRYFSGTLDAGATDWGTAHNLYLHHFAERGLLGLAALGWLLWTLWGRALERARRAPDAWNLWAFAVVTAFLVMNLAEVALQVEIVWILVFSIWIRAETRFRRVVPEP